MPSRRGGKTIAAPCGLDPGNRRSLIVLPVSAQSPTRTRGNRDRRGWTTSQRQSAPTKGSKQAVVGTSASVAEPDGAQRLVWHNAPALFRGCRSSLGSRRAVCAKSAPDEAAKILAYRVGGHELARSGRVRGRGLLLKRLVTLGFALGKLTLQIGYDLLGIGFGRRGQFATLLGRTQAFPGGPCTPGVPPIPAVRPTVAIRPLQTVPVTEEMRAMRTLATYGRVSRC